MSHVFVMSPERNGRCICYPLRLRRLHRAAPEGEAARQVLYVKLGEGWGEACPAPASGETVSDSARILTQLLAALRDRPEMSPQEMAAWLKEIQPMQPAARAALETARFDQAARAAASQPLFAYLRLPSPEEGAPSSFRITLGSEAEIEARLDEARPFPSLKLQGSGHAARDRELLRWLGHRTDQALRLDAGGAWSFEEARAMLPLLARLRVEYLEQPLPRHTLEETARLMRLSPVPILLGEGVRTACELDHLAGACNGFVIRLMNTGGLCEALRLIRRGRALGLAIALDTSIESSVAVSAAAHLAGAVDYANLSIPLHLENDPFEGVGFEQGRLRLPARPGLGVRLRREYQAYFQRPGSR